jgi:hypothetical protein
MYTYLQHSRTRPPASTQACANVLNNSSEGASADKGVKQRLLQLLQGVLLPGVQREVGQQR